MRSKLDRRVYFDGGLWTNKLASEAPPHTLTTATNFRYVAGSRECRKRFGSKRLDTTNPTSSVRTIIPMLFLSGTQRIYIQYFDGRIDYLNGTTYTNVAAAGSVGSQLLGTAVLNNVLFLSDIGPLNSIASGDVFTGNIAGTPAQVSALATYNLRLFGSGSGATGHTLYYSALNDGSTLGNVGAGGGAINLSRQITGLATVGSSLLIFHPVGISRFTGWSIDDFQVDEGQRGITTSVGCSGLVAQNIAVQDEKAYFTDDRLKGFYEVTEQSIRRISIPIDNQLTAITANGSNGPSIINVPSQNEIWFSLFGIATTPTTWVWNYLLEKWTGPWTSSVTTAPFGITNPTRFAHDLQSTTVYAANSANLYNVNLATVYKDNVQNDDSGGTVVNGTVRPRPIRMPSDVNEYT